MGNTTHVQCTSSPLWKQRLLAITVLQAKFGGPNRAMAQLLADGYTPEAIVQQWDSLHQGKMWQCGLGERSAIAPEKSDPEALFNIGVSAGARLIAPGDSEWPAQLDSRFHFLRSARHEHPKAQDPSACLPWGLWVRGGNLAVLTARAIAIVGTRHLSRYGHEVTTMIVRELAERGYTIVSGGALGVDAVAHRTALECGAPTIAVVACGIDQSYPAKHRELFAEIATSGGAVVSEYCPTTRPARHRFLTRNRLIAACSLGTVVTEAPWRSGALNTLSWAGALGTIPMVVPGSVMSASSRGCNEAIRLGRGHLVGSVADVEELVAPVGSVDAHGEADALFAASVRADSLQNLSREHVRIFDEVRREYSELQHIAARAGVGERAAKDALKQLEKLQLVENMAGQWRLCKQW